MRIYQQQSELEDDEELPLTGAAINDFASHPLELHNPPGDDSLLQQVFVSLRPNWRRLFFSGFRMEEISGSLGDMGTVI